MDSLPVEILHPIFLLACTDGGRTGCALSRTSKRIREISRTARFHTVSLLSGSPSQVVHFVACFSAERERAGDAMPRVRHLCLTSAQQAHSPLTRRLPGSRSAHLEDAYDSSSRTDDEQELKKETQRYLRDVMALLQMLAPDLETLCLIDPESRGNEMLHLPTFLIAGFPRVVELAIIGLEPVFKPEAGATTPLWPRLRTVHRIFLPCYPRIDHFPRAFEMVKRQWKDPNRAPRLADVYTLQITGLRGGKEIADALEKLRKERETRFSPMLTELLAASPISRRRRESVS